MASRFFLKLGDTEPPATMTVDLTYVPNTLVGASCVIRWQLNQPGSPVVQKTAAIIDTLYGVLSYQWQPGDITVAGEYFVDFKVTFLDGNILTFPNDSDLLLEVAPALPVV